MPKKADDNSIELLVKRIQSDIQQNLIGDVEQKLPTEPEMMDRYRVTRYALRQALVRLSNLGYLYQAQGIGTFVRPRPDIGAIAALNSGGLTAEFERQGRMITTISVTKRMVTRADAEFSPLEEKMPLDTKLVEVKRQRLLDNQPFMLETSYYVSDLVGEIPEDALYGSLFDFIATNRKVKLGFQDTLVTAEKMKDSETNFFQQHAGTPVQEVRDETYLSSGQLLAFSCLRQNYQLSKLFIFKRL